MRKLREKYNTSMLMITHDLGIVAEVCDEVSIMYAGRIVEHGTLEDIFESTSHPYTEGLFGSLPNIEQRTARLKPIPGLMPDPTNLPSGCPFHPRCKYATELCAQRVPAKTQLTPTHSVCCLGYEEGTGVTLNIGGDN
jgi:peptide/nickel transport system ATP-binding protein